MNDTLFRNYKLLNMHRAIFLRMAHESSRAAWRRWQACATSDSYTMYLVAKGVYATANLSSQARFPFRSDN